MVDSYRRQRDNKSALGPKMRKSTYLWRVVLFKHYRLWVAVLDFLYLPPNRRPMSSLICSEGFSASTGVESTPPRQEC
jgi:hypothetical protein